MQAKDLIPIPDILSMRTVVAFSPHPDDNEVGAGATLARLIQTGATVHWAVATDGSVGTEQVGATPDGAPMQLASVRQREQEAAMRVLGGQDLHWMGFQDMTLSDHRRALTEEVYGLIRTIRPDLVLAPDPWLPYESHPDHRTLGLVVAEAVIMANFPLIHPEAGRGCAPPAVAFYGTAWPNTRVDVSSTFGLKLAALAAHRSQFPPEELRLIGFYLRARAEEWGAEAGVTLAEAFKVLTHHHLHFNVDAWKS